MKVTKSKILSLVYVTGLEADFQTFGQRQKVKILQQMAVMMLLPATHTFQEKKVP